MNRTLASKLYLYAAYPSAGDDEVTDSFPLGEDNQVEIEIIGIVMGGSFGVPLVECSLEVSNDGQNWESTSSVEISDLGAVMLTSSKTSAKLGRVLLYMTAPDAEGDYQAILKVNVNGVNG